MPARVAAVLFARTFLVAGAAQAQPVDDDPYADRPRTCEGCHALAQHDTFELRDGTRVSAYVDPATHAGSRHGRGGADMACTDCHRRINKYPHDPVRAKTRHDYRVQQSLTCYRCHFRHFTHFLDSVHFAQIQEGNEDAPSCVDCHSAHSIRDTESEPRLTISKTCGRCHEKVAKAYAASVHGRAADEGDPDVPVCTDCHGTHEVRATKNRAFHAGSYLVCARCHGDAERMRQHDLTADVLDTYLDDFHGSSNQLFIEVGYVPAQPVATCADCHGHHDVQAIHGKSGARAARKRVSQMCARCHKGASASFADAWLSHSAPTFAATPLVWMVQWGYRILIPLMLLGLIIHIALHLYRATFGPRGKERS